MYIPPNFKISLANRSGYAHTIFTATLYSCKSDVKTVKPRFYSVVSVLAFEQAVIIVSRSEGGKISIIFVHSCILFCLLHCLVLYPLNSENKVGESIA